ncbi:MAG: hypothetical protein E7589_03535 [Ruminococcaceae bacterium]|nr:hypothetical protein [Oscillospiraceae bacterium]
MKKTKSILLAVMALVLAALLCACSSGSSADIGKLINTEYDLTEELYTKMEELDELSGYAYVGGNEWLGVFADVDLKNGTSAYKILNLAKGEVVITLENEDYLYTVHAEDGVPALHVVKTEIGDSIKDLLDSTYTLYNVNGDKLTTNDRYEPEAPEMFTDDLLIYDHAAYSVDENGNASHAFDIPEYLMPMGSYTAQSTDKYFVLTYSEKAVVLDREFNRVSSYVFPENATGGAECNVLNNGNLLVQYFAELPEDATDYDVYCGADGADFASLEANKKYDMVSLLVDASNGSTRELSLDWCVAYSVCGSEIRRLGDGQIADGVENLAVVLPIIDKRLCGGEGYIRTALLSNDGKLEWVQYVENQGFNTPTKIADGVYYMATLDGAVLLDKDGKVTKTLNHPNLVQVGAYFIGDVAIYDLELNSVYNLAQNDAEVLGVVGGSVFVEQETEDGYKIVMLRGGEEKTVYTYDDDTKEQPEFELNGHFGYTVSDKESGETEYYNAAAELIDTVDVSLINIAVNDNYDNLYFAGEDGGEPIYYVIKTTAK